MSLSAKIFLGLGLGIATGIFLGEIAAPLKAVGAAYVQLLQMAVLPYIMITLMSGLGKLKYAEAVRLSLRVGSLLVLIWALTFAVLYSCRSAFPIGNPRRSLARRWSIRRSGSISLSSFRATLSIRWPTISCLRWCFSASR